MEKEADWICGFSLGIDLGMARTGLALSKGFSVRPLTHVNPHGLTRWLVVKVWDLGVLCSSQGPRFESSRCHFLCWVSPYRAKLWLKMPPAPLVDSGIGVSWNCRSFGEIPSLKKNEPITMSLNSPQLIEGSIFELVLELRGQKLELRIMNIAEQEEADEFIIGLPKSSDGKETTQSKIVRSIAGRLAVRAAERGWRVYLQDEYGTTTTAMDRMIDMGLSKSARQNKLDAYAATMLLERYFSTSGQKTELVVPKNLELQGKLRKGPPKDEDFFSDDDDFFPDED
ncbi:holliday junction resolvase-like protein [Trifolium pratense]|uniref:Holliday junction resolvase-like protein n=3 Tax=Trifolium pratense TaxID=57577 RepID=A0A2K3MYZ5_TRIPR|nr:holliday junction resolvase-like protein [Trifolium pratense]PNX96060.1 holliday junction resolvase-like protein [Trifolium pratense]